MELVAVSDDADQAASPAEAKVAKTKETTLKELAGDESLSEEARDSAMKALEVLVASQLAEVEREAADRVLRKSPPGHVQAGVRGRRDDDLGVRLSREELLDDRFEEKNFTDAHGVKPDSLRCGITIR